MTVSWIVQSLHFGHPASHGGGYRVGEQYAGVQGVGVHRVFIGKLEMVMFVSIEIVGRKMKTKSEALEE